MSLRIGFGIILIVLGLLSILFSIDYANENILSNDEGSLGIYQGVMWLLYLVLGAVFLYTLFSLILALVNVGKRYQSGR